VNLYLFQPEFCLTCILTINLDKVLSFCLSTFGKSRTDPRHDIFPFLGLIIHGFKLTTGYENKLNNAMNELNNTLRNVGNKIELIKSRYDELSDNLNDGDRANGILNAHLGLNIGNGQKIK